jgi:hypothetical protein
LSWWGLDMPTDEKFFVWLDEELERDEAARVEAEIGGDARLSSLAVEHRAMQARMKRAFGTIVDAPVPAALVDAVRGPQTTVVHFNRRAPGSGRPLWRMLPPWLSLATMLAVGIIIGTVIPPRATNPIEISGGQLYAAAALDNALDTQLSSAPTGETRIGLTFRDRSGEICRSFTQAQSSGLACRDANRWQVRGLFAAPEGQTTAYRMAAGMDPNLAALVDSTIAGEPFDAATERAARDRGWR